MKETEKPSGLGVNRTGRCERKPVMGKGRAWPFKVLYHDYMSDEGLSVQPVFLNSLVWLYRQMICPSLSISEYPDVNKCNSHQD